ncbi:MAG TPA: glycosyltransferase 87 family protein [Streptosporangiaceae bacterium]
MRERVLSGGGAAPGQPPGAGGTDPAEPPAVTFAARIRRLAAGNARWIGLAVCVVLIAEAGVVLWYAATHRQVDFSVYLWGGHAVAQDSRLYLVAAHGHWFTYPPFAAAPFAALTVIPFTAAQVLWALASLIAFAIACHLALRLAGTRPSWTATAAVVAAGLALEPVYHTLFNGQINTILLAFVLADVWRVAQGRRAGIGIGIAAAIKLTPGIFVLLFLLTRRTTAALTAMAAFAVCTLAGYLVAPAGSRLYWTRFFYDTKRVDAPYIGNQSLYGTAVRVLSGESHAGGWFLLLPLAVAVVGLATATVFGRRGEWLTAAAVTGVTSLLISPVSWTHHWVWIMPALIMLARGARGDRVAAVCGGLLFAAAPLWWTPHSLSQYDYGFHWLLTLVANCYVLVGIVFLAVMAWRARTVLARAAGAPRQRAGPTIT